jgi:apolipoprotein N-acyltransferase
MKLPALLAHRRWQRVQPWLMAVLAGTSLAAALPGLYWVPLLLLFPGLLLESLYDAPGGWTAFLRGWLAGIVHWAIATSWVVPVMHDYGGLGIAGALICLLIMAGLIGLTWGLVCWLTSRAGATYRIWLLPAAWSAVEAWRQLPPYLFPWNPTVSALTELPAALGSLPVWGATGLGWAVTAIGAGLWGLWRGPRQPGRWSRRGPAVQLLAAASLLLLFTAMAPAARTAKAATGRPLVVAVLQPGTSLEEKWDPSNSEAIAKKVWQLTREAMQSRPRPDLVLWPESAVPYIVERDPGFRRMLIALARDNEIAIVLNSIGFTSSGGYTNAAYLVTGTGVSARRYDKVRLVPFGEYVPFFARLAFTESLVREVASFTPGDRPELLDGPVPLGMAICYEVVFADLVAEEVRRGAQVLTTITNDGWYGYSWAPPQHFSQSVLRAAENRRWLVRAALTGISGVVDPYGRVVDRLAVGESGFLVAEVQPATGLTPRTRFGDWWGLLCAAATLALLVAGRRAMGRGERG